MLHYILRRIIIYSIPTLIGITIVTFAIIHLTPGNPITISEQGLKVGENRFNKNEFSKKAYQEMMKLYGLDKPLHIQYILWVKRIIVFDFGNSFSDGRPVINKIAERIFPTLILNIISLFFVIALSIPLGIYSAIKRNSLFDRFSTVVVFLLYSLPSFWIALLLIILFGVKLDWLPFYGMKSDNADSLSLFETIIDRIKHLILPVICITYGGFAGMSRYVRSGMLDVIRQDYIRTARAKGLSENIVIYKHAFRNSLIPLVTLLGFMLPGLIGGSVILEYIFAWPGMGRLFFEAVLSRDYPLIMGESVISAILVLLGNLLADLLYCAVDPRISFE